MIKVDDLGIGSVIGGFQIESVLGRGGMGVVYKAHELSLNRKVALKVLSQRLSSDQEFIQRFKREAQVIAALEHPNIVRVLSYGEEEGVYYFAMEYISGKNLGQILQEKTIIPLEEALNITAQAASGLAEAGARGVVHRDLKPTNIMIDEKGRVKITDFGVAHFQDGESKLTRTGWFLGTPEFASPEQAKGLPLDVRSDIYSLGAVLYWMLAGRAPITGHSPQAVLIKIATESLPSIRNTNPSVPGSVCKMIERMTAKDPGQRFQKPEEIISTARDCLNQISLPTTRSKDRQEGRKVERSYSKVIGGILGIGLAVFLSVWAADTWILKRKPPAEPLNVAETKPSVSPAVPETATPIIEKPAEKPGPIEIAPIPSVPDKTVAAPLQKPAKVAETTKPAPSAVVASPVRSSVEKPAEKPRPTEAPPVSSVPDKTVAASLPRPVPVAEAPKPAPSAVVAPLVHSPIEKPAERPRPIEAPPVSSVPDKTLAAPLPKPIPVAEAPKPPPSTVVAPPVHSPVEKPAEKPKAIESFPSPSVADNTVAMKRSPAIRETPIILIAASGDERIVPLLRGHLEAIIIGSGLKVIPITEIPRLREKVQMGGLPITYYGMKDAVPPGKVDILLLAQAQKAGSMTLQYYGRTDELVTVTFTVQTVDMDTGTSAGPPAIGSAKFTSLNMDKNLRDALYTAAGRLGEGIKRYWGDKLRASKKDG